MKQANRLKVDQIGFQLAKAWREGDAVEIKRLEEAQAEIKRFERNISAAQELVQSVKDDLNQYVENIQGIKQDLSEVKSPPRLGR